MTGPPPGRDVPPEEIRKRESHETGDVDVLAVHRQAFREPQEPGEGAERGPWWFWAAAVLALVFGGFYLGRYSGVFTGAAAVHTGVDAPHAAATPAGPGTAAAAGARATAGAPVDGASVFSSRCAMCHQATGQGLPGAFPPLAGSEYALGDAERAVRIVLRGLSGPVTVKGLSFNGAMPAWADQLSDAEIAAVLTYVRSSFGNAAPAVTADVVAAQRSATASRTAPWTVGELGK
ncbi:MAG: cytochrome c [Gemmatimonadales bacterium]|jgi:mono/diheme cytochrome c family protein